MANLGLVAFLRRQDWGHAQSLFQDSLATHEICTKAIDELCTQLRGKAGQGLEVNDGKRKKSVTELRSDAHRIGAELADIADASKPMTDRKAELLLGELLEHAHDIVDVVEQIKGRHSAPDLLGSARELAHDCSSLLGICDAYQTGARDSQKRTRIVRPH